LKGVIEDLSDLPNHESVMIEAHVRLNAPEWKGEALIAKLGGAISWLQHFDLSRKKKLRIFSS
jgi:hypothetical protein